MERMDAPEGLESWVSDARMKGNPGLRRLRLWVWKGSLCARKRCAHRLGSVVRPDELRTNNKGQDERGQSGVLQLEDVDAVP